MGAYRPDQRNVVSSAGELPQLDRAGASPDGVYSGALKREKLVDGYFVQPATTRGVPGTGARKKTTRR